MNAKDLRESIHTAWEQVLTASDGDLDDARRHLERLREIEMCAAQRLVHVSVTLEPPAFDVRVDEDEIRRRADALCKDGARR